MVQDTVPSEDRPRHGDTEQTPREWFGRKAARVVVILLLIASGVSAAVGVMAHRENQMANALDRHGELAVAQRVEIEVTRGGKGCPCIGGIRATVGERVYPIHHTYPEDMPERDGRWRVLSAGDDYGPPLVIRFIPEHPDIAMAQRDVDELKGGDVWWACALAALVLLGAGLAIGALAFEPPLQEGVPEESATWRALVWAQRWWWALGLSALAVALAIYLAVDAYSTAARLAYDAGPLRVYRIVAIGLGVVVVPLAVLTVRGARRAWRERPPA